MSFYKWLSQLSRKAKTLILSLSFLPPLLKAIGFSPAKEAIPDAVYTFIPFIANATVIFLVLFVITRIKANYRNLESSSSKPVQRYAEKNVETFLFNWKGLWISWCFMYAGLLVGLLLKNYYAESDHEDWIRIGGAVQQLAGNAIGNVVNAFIIIAYLSLLKVKREKNRNPYRPLEVIYTVFGVSILIELVLFYARVKGDLDSPAFVQLEFYSALFYGMVGSVGFALLVGRLDSKFMAVPTAVIVALYFYAMLQLAVNVVETWTTRSEVLIAQGTSTLSHKDEKLLRRPAVDNSSRAEQNYSKKSPSTENSTTALQLHLKMLSVAHWLVYALACPLKILLGLIVFWLLAEGRMHFYFEQMILAEESKSDSLEMKFVKFREEIEPYHISADIAED